MYLNLIVSFVSDFFCCPKEMQSDFGNRHDSHFPLFLFPFFLFFSVFFVLTLLLFHCCINHQVFMGGSLLKYPYFRDGGFYFDTFERIQEKAASYTHFFFLYFIILIFILFCLVIVSSINDSCDRPCILKKSL